MSLKSLLLVTVAIVAQLKQIHSSTITQNLFVFGGLSPNDYFYNLTSRLNSTSGTWTSVKDMPTGRALFCGAVAGDKIYLLGGVNDRGYTLASGDAYDYSTDTYTAIQPMPEARQRCAAAGLNGSIYVSGGLRDNQSTPLTFLRYDIRSNEWSTLSPMNKVNQWNHRLVELDGLLYAVYGTPDKTCEVYNPATDQWSYIASKNYYSGLSGTTVYQGLIYDYGYSGFEVYSPITNQWTVLKVSPEHDSTRWHRPLVTMNGKLWKLGGWSKTDVVSKIVETYDPSSGQWSKQRDMDVPRRLHQAFVVNQ